MSILTPGTVILIITFILNNRRLLKIALEFLKFEARTFWLPIFLTLLISLIFFIVVRFGKEKTVNFTLFINELKQMVVRSPYYIKIFISVILIIFLCQYLSIRYRIFSEVYFPQKALTYLKDGKYRKAKLISDKYLKMYPQRQPKGGIADPICNPILLFTSKMDTLRTIMNYQVLDPVERIDGVEIWNLWSTSQQAKQIIIDYSGE